MKFTIPETAEGQFNFPNGTVKHYQKGKKQGLVTLPDGTQKWYHNNSLHRDGHPAIVYPNGKTEWYAHGVKYATVYFKKQYTTEGENIAHNLIDPAIITEFVITNPQLKVLQDLLWCNALSYEDEWYAVDGVIYGDDRDFNDACRQHRIEQFHLSVYNDLLSKPSATTFTKWADGIKRYVSENEFNNLIQLIEQKCDVKVVLKSELEKTFNQSLVII